MPASRTAANKANALYSTGPRTSEGKSRVAKNALRHGLAVPVAMDSTLAAEVERLSCMIAGPDSHPLRRSAARLIAEAQVDLLRVRKARNALLSDPKARIEPVPETIIRFRKFVQKQLRNAAKRMPHYAERIEANVICIAGPEEVILYEGLDVLAKPLARLDRYERRALSRRKFAIRLFDSLTV